MQTRGLRRSFGSVMALDGVDLEVAPGEFFSLLGPSGCGKTTLLRVIAGLEAADSGELQIHGISSLGIPAYRRPVHTVFQSYALFPHLTVQGNVEFGLRMRGVATSERGVRVRAALELVGIGDLARRRPDELSGGQRQRVALARALVNEPKILLLDEPLSALDVQLRQRIREELRELQRRTRVTFILVTHDQEEALAVSDRMAVMRAGRVEQVGPGRELYLRPVNRFVAECLGACNVLAGTVAEVREGAVVVELGGVRLAVAKERFRASTAMGAKVWIGIRPEHVVIEAPSETSVRESDGDGVRIPGVMREQTYTGTLTQYSIEVLGAIVRVTRVSEAEGGRMSQPGDSVRIRIPGEHVMGWDGMGEAGRGVGER